MSKKKLPDPATEGKYNWTQKDIDTALEELGRRAMQGKFNPSTWEGEAFVMTFSDGATREVMPKYFGYVYVEWRKLEAS